MLILKKPSPAKEKSHDDPLRIVIGGGALGLCIAHRIFVEFPDSN